MKTKGDYQSFPVASWAGKTWPIVYLDARTRNSFNIDKNLKITKFSLIALGLSVFFWFCEFVASKSISYDFGMIWAKLALSAGALHFIVSSIWIFSVKSCKFTYRFLVFAFGGITIILNTLLYVWFVSWL